MIEKRYRRLRKNDAIRNMVAETSIIPSDLILPLFVCADKGDAGEIESFFDIKRHWIGDIAMVIDEYKTLGIKSFMLFPYIKPELKNRLGNEALNPNNTVCNAIRRIKDRHPDVVIMADVALDPYTLHGHDGILTSNGDDVDNDATVEILCQQALINAKAGCDIITPSDMMDCKIQKLRQTLDSNEFSNVSIISYAVKFASKLYSPFRSAVGSSLSEGPKDKKTYQMDFRNSDLSIQAAIDELECGADGIIIKPAGWYLDIIYKARQEIKSPILAYQVSGEYAMICNSCHNYDDRIAMAIESILCIKRAGANAIISYFADEICKELIA